MGLCMLCEEAEGSTEHYFECKRVRFLRDVCEVKAENLRSQNIAEMKDVASFMNKVEMLVQPDTRGSFLEPHKRITTIDEDEWKELERRCMKQ